MKLQVIYFHAVHIEQETLNSFCVRAVFSVGMTILDMESTHVAKRLARSHWATSSIDMCRLLLFFLLAAH